MEFADSSLGSLPRRRAWRVLASLTIQESLPHDGASGAQALRASRVPRLLPRLFMCFPLMVQLLARKSIHREKRAILLACSLARPQACMPVGDN